MCYEIEISNTKTMILVDTLYTKYSYLHLTPQMYYQCEEYMHNDGYKYTNDGFELLVHFLQMRTSPRGVEHRRNRTNNGNKRNQTKSTKKTKKQNKNLIQSI